LSNPSLRTRRILRGGKALHLARLEFRHRESRHRLEVKVLLTSEAERTGQGVLRLGKRLLRRFAAGDPAVVHDVERVGLERFLDCEDKRQVFVFDLDLARRPLSLELGLGDDGADDLAVTGDFVLGEEELVDGGSSPSVRLLGRQIAPIDIRKDAFHLESFLGVDREDLGVRLGRQDQREVAFVGKVGHVVQVNGLARRMLESRDVRNLGTEHSLCVRVRVVTRRRRNAAVDDLDSGSLIPSAQGSDAQRVQIKAHLSRLRRVLFANSVEHDASFFRHLDKELEEE
jgi:hypothetical protein